MKNRILLFTVTAFLLAYGAASASAQYDPGATMTQDLQMLQQGENRWVQPAQMRRRDLDNDDDDDDRRSIHGWRRGGMDRGMTGPGGMMGPHRRVMRLMLFSLMDTDGDGALSVEEFRSAHERIFKAMDANKDGRLTPEEMQSFIQGTGR